MVWHVRARLGAAGGVWHGLSGRGGAALGGVRQVGQARSGMAGQGGVWQGLSWSGRLGEAGLGGAR